MPVVLTFFGQINLIQGGKILGWCVALIRSIALMLAVTIITLSNYITPQINEIQRKSKEATAKEGVIGRIFASDPILFFYITTAFTALGIVVALLFVLGIYKKNKSYLLPFIIFDVLNLIVWITHWIGSFTHMIAHGDYGHFLLTTIFVVLIGYLFVCSIAVFQHLADLENVSPPPMEFEMETPNMSSTPVYRVPLPRIPSTYFPIFQNQTTRV